MIPILFNFFTQGYLFTALLLFFGYCFDKKFQTFYVELAKTANRLAGLFLLVYLLLMFITVLGASIFILTVEKPSFFGGAGDWLIFFLFQPYVYAFIILAIPKLRHYRIWVLLPVAFLLNTAFIGNMIYGDFSSAEYTAWEKPFSPGVRMVLYTLVFLMLIVFLRFMTERMKKEVKKAENKMPERV